MTTTTRHSPLALLCAALLLAACGSPTDGTPDGTDAGSDAGTDAGTDAGAPQLVTISGLVRGDSDQQLPLAGATVEVVGVTPAIATQSAADGTFSLQVAAGVRTIFLRAAAALHVADDPPRDGRLLVYGAGFPDFLARFEPAASLPYLPGVARLDALWREAHAAADAAVIAPDALSGLPPEALGTLRLQPHPAARWACFDGHPVFAIWQRNRDADGGDDAAPVNWQGDGGLLTRPTDAVQAQALCRGGCALLDACADGATLGEAAERASAAHPDTDLARVLAQLLRAGVFLPLTPS